MVNEPMLKIDFGMTSTFVKQSVFPSFLASLLPESSFPPPKHARRAQPREYFWMQYRILVDRTAHG